jgi:taurine dioxygenase
MASVTWHPLSEHVGVEARDVDLNALDDDTFGALRAAVADHGVLFIRDQSLTPEQHIAFARRWGEIDINRYFPANGGHPEIAEVRKAENQQTNIGGGWHTDHSYDPVPAMGSILLARETRAVHSADHIYSADGIYAKTDQAADLKGHDERTHAEHPVVIRHPATGREILYVNPAFTLHFAGWTRAESLPLLTYLYQVAMQEKFHCRVSWAPGSIAIWDNRSTWHCAMNDYQGHRRLMHRITIAGEPLT